MADLEQLEIVKQGAQVWNAWKEKTTPSVIDLSRGDLSGMDLQGINLSGANLRESSLDGTNLSDAILTHVYFGRTSLRKADLRSASLWWANFWNADLTEANLMEAGLWHANLVNANCFRSNFQSADLTYAVLVETNFEGADLTNATVYGVSAWDLRLQDANQKNLVITQPTEPHISVDDLEVAQFIYLLLNHQKLRNVLNAVTNRGVLILGRFGGGGLDILNLLADELRAHKYLPIIFDFERPASRDYTETVKVLFGLSRFVIADLSGPSVPQELYASVPFYEIPLIPILQSDRRAYSMFRDLFKYPWVHRPPFVFADRSQLAALVASQIIPAAEQKFQDRQVLLAELFPKSD